MSGVPYIGPNCVVAGSDSEKLAAAREWQDLLLLAGVGGITVYLNGGSGTRRDAIAYWREYARNRNLGCQVSGNCVVVIGGREG